jgi:hypothetical protein
MTRLEENCSWFYWRLEEQIAVSSGADYGRTPASIIPNEISALNNGSLRRNASTHRKCNGMELKIRSNQIETLFLEM